MTVRFVQVNRTLVLRRTRVVGNHWTIFLMMMIWDVHACACKASRRSITAHQTTIVWCMCGYVASTCPKRFWKICTSPHGRSWVEPTIRESMLLPPFTWAAQWAFVCEQWCVCEHLCVRRACMRWLAELSGAHTKALCVCTWGHKRLACECQRADHGLASNLLSGSGYAQRSMSSHSLCYAGILPKIL